MKKLLTLLLLCVLSFTLICLLTSCGIGSTAVPCAHTDANNDGICDLCRTKMPKDPSTSGHTHTPDAPVRELEVAASCDRDGRYDEVVYCADCAEELSRVKKIVPSRGGHDLCKENAHSAVF